MAWKGAGVLAGLQPGGPSGRRACLELSGGRAEGLEGKVSGRAAEGSRPGWRPSPTLSPDRFDAGRCEDSLRARHTGRALATGAATAERVTAGGHSGRDWDTRSRKPDPGGARPARRVDGRALVSGRSTRREGRRHPRSVLCCRTGRHGVEGSRLMFIDRMPAGAYVRCFGRTSAQSTIIPPRRAGSDVEPAPPEEV